MLSDTLKEARNIYTKFSLWWKDYTEWNNQQANAFIEEHNLREKNSQKTKPG